MNRLRNQVTENYWKAKDIVDGIFLELCEIQERLSEAEKQMKVLKKDFDYMWDNIGHEEADVIFTIASHYGICPDRINWNEEDDSNE